MSPANPALHGRTVLITGAGGDLGAVAAEACAGAGATVILLGRTLGRLEATYDRIVRHGGSEPLLAPLDLATATLEELSAIAGSIESRLGALHGLIHCAAHMDYLGPLRDVGDAQWRDTLDVNLTGAFRLTRTLLPLLTRSEAAAAVFVSDSEAERRRSYWGPYAVAKAGLEAFARILADEYESAGTLRVNLLTPGAIRTRLRRKAFPTETAPEPGALAARFVDLMRSDSPYANGERIAAAVTPSVIEEEIQHVRT
ncbi:MULTISPECIES: SDR family NAD(P)-dependent oxidoreductase [Methylococcus]|uniref:Oxidoreductase, short-chain dehydrogenase/reductase family n=1 Tax=Methylococcus capsulatus (strain ATCC 33009 / NCIMB 11132 / Bath) TaxID=243233 RepID=Q609G3_METCA|nr:SDR family NAD(P)-dependent oxidoreductase [Methylococcus capsulatus]AAU92429.1 oxidoreductase, short-chain dehydrogenase/reductase family [Methylococcus capsulatus str. Bath]